MAGWQFPGIAHGADYYPEQWLDRPEILEADLEMMVKARVNLVTLGVFAWAMEEPEEGVFRFDWLRERLDALHARGIRVLLATPSGARPNWLAEKYPEVQRVGEDRRRNLPGMRMNHCYTSPVYRRLTQRIDTELARRFARHPAVVGWHISNEYHGECHCPLCQEAFRGWLQRRYGTLERLNAAWWTGFWSKHYTDWRQIASPSSLGERALPALRVDWLRFVTDQTRDFMSMEVEAVRPFNPVLPVTTNMIGRLIEIDTPRFRDLLDVAALDIYPEWGSGDDAAVADAAAMEHDLTRCLLDKPYLLLETTPSMTNWQAVGQPKRPGMHMLCAMQAIAHGADAFMMFQWRKARGGFEKFHGAVVSHDGRDDTRVFREVAETGARLARLGELKGSVTHAQAALIFDWNNRWAIGACKGPREGIDPDGEALAHYRALAALGIDVDVIDSEHGLDDYRLVCAPMLYMLKSGVAERLERFVCGGGTLLMTCFSALTDESDLCFDTGAPGPLRKLLGLRVEELDTLYPHQRNRVRFAPDGPLGGMEAAECDFWCEILHAETAETAAVYESDYYRGMPAVTRNRFGDGEAWYLGTRLGLDALRKVHASLSARAGIALQASGLSKGVRVHCREKDGVRYLFLLNFGDEPGNATIPPCVNLETGQPAGGMMVVPARQALVFRQAAFHARD